MTQKRSSHGNTPAAWTTVSIALVAFLVGAFGIVVSNMNFFWVGIGLLVVAGVVGKVMQMAGLGQHQK